MENILLLTLGVILNTLNFKIIDEMEKYKNLSGDSGVEGFDIGSNFIRVKFKNNPKLYQYSYSKARMHHVEQMKHLAQSGSGLNSYIKKNTNYLYD